jgi:hypothetical protein
MSLTLSFLFIRFLAHVRGPHRLAGIMPEPLWLWLVVSLALLFIGELISRRLMPSLWPRFQRHAVQ